MGVANALVEGEQNVFVLVAMRYYAWISDSLSFSFFFLEIRCEADDSESSRLELLGIIRRTETVLKK